MEFNSQICTTVEQSKRLLELGLKKETADCHFFYQNAHWKIKTGFDLISCENLYPKYYIPAWSLHRLMEMYGNNYNYIRFQNAYSELIHAISISIEDGTFNKDYLEEKQ